MRRFTDALGLTLRYWIQTEVHVYAFSVAANVLLSFFPFLIVSLTLARLVFHEQAVLGAINLALRDYFPDALQQFLFANLPQQGAPLPAISIVLLMFTANGVFEPLEVGLNRVWGIHRNRSFLRNQIVSLGLIFVCGGLALASLMLTALNQQSFRTSASLPAWLQSIVGGGFAFFSLLIFKLAALPLVVLMLFLVYRYLPNGRPPFARILPAAVGVGLLLEVLKYINALAWPAFQQRLAREYGVFQYSASLIFLSFAASMLVLAGAEWAARGHRLDMPNVDEAEDARKAGSDD